MEGSEKERDLGNRLTEGQQPGSCQFIELSGMPVVCKCRYGHISDIIGVDERLAYVSYGQCKLSGQYRFEEIVLAEVLTEPTDPQQRPFDSGIAYDLLATLRLCFASPG